ncbi:MAG: UDP-N-acetylmuramoyl-L-alanine--D-glutamate ligase [Rhodospirillaceae bacterium]|nr:UDP-N-acetylmuramoyl-L-alanine--D-glutamate ligase [Rhodospirillaceae bacterium]
MISVSAFSGKTVVVMGLGKSGLSAVDALVEGGARVWAWDDSADNRKSATQSGVMLTDIYQEDWGDIETLVLSPGIPGFFPSPHPIAEKARENGCEIICDVDLLARSNSEAQFVGITGSNGKSTTTALIGHMLSHAGFDTAVGGNIGEPVMGLDALGGTGTYVLELSSYQLERVPRLQLNVAVLLNICADHLDRHGGMSGYVAAKKSIFERVVQGGKAIIGMDDQVCRGISLELMVNSTLSIQDIIPISANGRVPGGVFIDGTVLVDDLENRQTPIVDLAKMQNLSGRHNWQNAAAAYASARIVGVEGTVIADALSTFSGLPHRQEIVRVIGNVRFINDSKATNSEATAKALASYENIFWIVGGQFKEKSVDINSGALSTVRHAYLIGDAQDLFAEVLDGKVPFTRSGDIEAAVYQASQAARAYGEPAEVLLSPACASFDQFASFESRGAVFRDLVETLS